MNDASSARGRGLVSAAGALVVAVGVTVALWPNDEQRIKEALDHLAESVHLDKDQNRLVFVAHARSALGKLLTDDVRMAVPELPSPVAGKGAVVDLVDRIPLALGALDVRFAGYEVKIDPGKTSAHVAATATIDAAEPSGTEHHDKRAMNFLVAKVEGSWRTSSITLWSHEDAPTR
jgi:hypothetical protein